MKTIFGRAVLAALLVLCLALTAVGVVFRLGAQSYLNDRALTALRKDAEAIAEQAGAYYTRSGLDGQAFPMTMALAARASGVDAVICDKKGTVLLCSESPLGCEHQGMSLGGAYFDSIFTQGFAADTGVIRGIYSDVRYVVGVPVLLRGSDLTAGAVVASISTAETTEILDRLMNIYLAVAIPVMLLGAVFITCLSRRQSGALRELSKAAADFGHGDLDARVQVNERAPEEMQELARSFNNMATSLQQTQVQQQEFVANVSHELKTPMTTVGGYVDGMLDGTIPPEKHRQYLRIVSDETKRLNRLVRSMLDISRDAQRIPEEQMQVFDICECVGQVLLTFEQAIEQKHLNVETEFPEYPVYTRAVTDAITQVVYNLVDNAVKFSEELLGVAVQETSDKVYVSVYNDGGTIPPEELPLVFDRFHKLDKSRADRNGWGLGLYIVKNLVCRHGEDISVSSSAGRTTFTFTLPHVN